jgi:RHS repeat-associated protein
MAVTNYYTIDGAIVGEQTSAGRINYATDALGSVTGTLVGNQLVNTYAYKPYGALLASTGSGTAPKQQWVGNLGYRPTGRAQSDYYVRARHYGSAPGRWTTVDPLWPGEVPYTLVGNSPLSVVDPSGYGGEGSISDSCLTEAQLSSLHPAGASPSKLTTFRQCQSMLERQYDYRLQNGIGEVCAGGHYEICLACKKVSGYPSVNCDNQPGPGNRPRSCAPTSGGAPGDAAGGSWNAGGLAAAGLTYSKFGGSIDFDTNACMAACMAASRGNMYPNWARQTCRGFCAALRTGACEKLFNLCSAQQGDRQKVLCLTLYLNANCPEIEVAG